MEMKQKGKKIIFGIVAVTIQIPINILYACNVEKEYMGRMMAIGKTLSTITAPCAMMLFAYRQRELMMQ